MIFLVSVLTVSVRGCGGGGAGASPRAAPAVRAHHAIVHRTGTL